ncbi:MAG: S-layer homology domain-containing protein [Bifidobacteriaceae bacterium]|jgi:hypothetical protein|nr:S-layer homology domain-containing protein [Bifidobacteriaceae bacterium]
MLKEQKLKIKKVVIVLITLILIFLNLSPKNAYSQLKNDNLPVNWEQVKQVLSPQTSKPNIKIYSQENVLTSFDAQKAKLFDNKNALAKYTASGYSVTPFGYFSNPEGKIYEPGADELSSNKYNSEKGYPYNFATDTFLPDRFIDNDENYGFKVAQSMVVLGDYFYILYLGYGYNNGVRYYTGNATILKVSKYFKNDIFYDGWNRISRFADRFANTWDLLPFAEYAKYTKYFTVGYSFDLKGAHGEALTTDGKNLWLLGAPQGNLDKSTYTHLSKINLESLTPEVQYKFNVQNASSGKYYYLNTAAFVSETKFYAATRYNGGYSFFEGNINNNKVSIKHLTDFKNPIGYWNQSLDYDFSRNLLYLTADSNFMTFSPNVLYNSNPDWRSVQYSQITGNREFEGVSFQNGSIYLILGYMAEIVISQIDTSLFWDYDVSHYAANDILWMKQKGYSTGYEDGTYRADLEVNRGQMALFFEKIFQWQNDPITVTNPFVDISPSDTCYKAVLRMFQRSITTGTDATHFSPTREIKREQFAAFLYRAQGRPFFEPSQELLGKFNDISQSSFKKEILWLVYNGISTGTTDSTFSPQNTIKRGQMATLFHRFDNFRYQ